MPTLKRLPREKLRTLVLKSGGHGSRSMKTLCAMEAVAWLAGEAHSAHPQCACPVIGGAVIRLNDRIPDDKMRTRLVRPLLPKLLGTRSTPEVEQTRRWIAVDFAIRIAAPLGLDVVGWKDLAARCRAITPITSRSSADAALPEIRAVRDEAWKRRSAAAADASAYAAAASAAAYAAAADAAAAYAAADAAYAAASAAAAAADAYAAVKGLVAREPIYRACVEMFERMIAVRAPKTTKRVAKNLAQQHGA